MKKSKRKSSISTEGKGKQNTPDETESDHMAVGIKKKKRNQQQRDREGEDLPYAKTVHVSEEKPNTAKKRENKMKDKETKTDQGGITQTEGKEILKLKNHQKRKLSNTAEANKTNETGNSEFDHTEKPTKKKKRKIGAQVEELENDADVESVDKSNSDREAKETTKSKKKKKKLKESENDAVEESSVNVAIEASGDKPDDADQKKTPQSKKKKKKLVQKESENDSAEDSGDKIDDAEVKKTPKSKKKKKKEKNVNENDQPTLDPEQKADKLASEYLKQWSSDRKSWKFQKVRQVWLLKHMYNSEQVSFNNDERTECANMKNVKIQYDICVHILVAISGKSRNFRKKGGNSCLWVVGVF